MAMNKIEKITKLTAVDIASQKKPSPPMNITAIVVETIIETMDKNANPKTNPMDKNLSFIKSHTPDLFLASLCSLILSRATLI